jgi:hypothetical protein
MAVDESILVLAMVSASVATLAFPGFLGVFLFRGIALPLFYHSSLGYVQSQLLQQQLCDFL